MASIPTEPTQPTQVVDTSRRRYERFLAQQPFPTTSAELWVAVLRYHPLKGAVRSREVLVYDRTHRLLRTQTLAGESPYTVWYAGDVCESWHPLRLSP